MEIVVMPKLGFNMDEGKLMTWYKSEGDAVSKGESLFSIETDKTSIDVEATQDGFVRELFISEGMSVPVTLPIAIIAGKDEDISSAAADARAQLGGVADSATGTAEKAPPPASVPAASTASAASVPEPAPSADGRDSQARRAALSEHDYGVIVIGGGPGGYVAAIRAAQLGVKAALVEKDKLGGTCLNRGCIPTKALLRSLTALKEVKESAAYGVSGADTAKAKLDMKKVQKRKASVVEQLVSGVGGLLAKNNVEVVKGEAVIADKNTVTVDGKDYDTANIIIATGSETKSLPDGVVQTDKALTSDTILDIASIPKEIVIIGGGVIGIEFAYFLSGAGAKVTVVEFLERILPPVDGEIAALVAADLEKEGIVIHTGAKVTKVTDKAVVFEKDGSAETIATKHVLIATGRAPRVCDDVSNLGVELDRGAIVTNERLETSVPGIYAIGDVNGKAMLAHTASAEGIVAAENIAGENAVMKYDAIPSAIYTTPEIASVGLSEENARARYGDIKVGRFPMFANGKSKVEGNETGLAKVIIAPEYGEIVGVHLYCLHATDMIASAGVAINAQATAYEWVDTVHPHPTVSEALQEAFHASVGQAIHF
jgi:dihydrolipoamide dehydrogenase